MISMRCWNGLTWFLCGGVDGQRLWPGASGVESSHRQVVHCVCFQPGDVSHSGVSRNADFANGVGLGVIFPVHNLWGQNKNSHAFRAIIIQVVVHLAALLKITSHQEFWNVFELQTGPQREAMHIIYFTAGVSQTHREACDNWSRRNLIASALPSEKQPVFSPLKLDIKCDEVMQNCKMLHVYEQIDFWVWFPSHRWRCEDIW